jgi:hypothetical protein
MGTGMPPAIWMPRKLKKAKINKSIKSDTYVFHRRRAPLPKRAHDARKNPALL